MIDLKILLNTAYKRNKNMYCILFKSCGTALNFNHHIEGLNGIQNLFAIL